MKALIELNTPEVVSTTAAQLVIRDPDTGTPIAEVAVRGAGYVVLTEDEKRQVAIEIVNALNGVDGLIDPADIELLDREGGYLGEPRLWEQVAEEQAAKRAASRGGSVIKVGAKRVKVYESLSDIPYPEGATFGEDGIIVVPSRKLDSSSPTAKSFRRACKRAKASQLAFLAAQKDPSAVEEGEADEDGEE